jgi:hypothetical protein
MKRCLYHIIFSGGERSAIVRFITLRVKGISFLGNRSSHMRIHLARRSLISWIALGRRGGEVVAPAQMRATGSSSLHHPCGGSVSTSSPHQLLSSRVFCPPRTAALQALRSNAGKSLACPRGATYAGASRTEDFADPATTNYSFSPGYFDCCSKPARYVMFRASIDIIA